MKANEKALTFLRDQYIYIIPYFQRGYVWDEDNWNGIWQELTAPRMDCFLGSIILKTEEYPNRQEQCKTIIDGQQRLTTLTILLRALHDFYHDKADSDTLQHFRELIFYRYTQWLDTETKTIEKCRIEHSRLNKNDYTNVIEGKVNPEEVISDPQQNNRSSGILRCYKFFRDQLSTATLEEVNRVRQKLIVDSSKILVVIDLNEKENEQVIFDTINRTGVKLTASDIIKNALFQKVRQSGNDLDDFYRESWQHTFEDNQEKLDAWLETKGLGQNQRSHIDLFFYSFAIIEGFFRIPGDKMSDLAGRYKEYVEKMDAIEARSFIRKICDYADSYYDTFIGFDEITAYKFDDGKTRLLQILDATNITAFDPFVLYALKKYSEDQQAKVFSKLECYVMRHYVIGNTSKMGSFLQDAVKMIKESFDFNAELSDDLISDIRLGRAIRGINNNKAKLVLFWIELHRHTKRESDLFDTPLNYAYELEHIMPQKWTEYWNAEVLPILNVEGKPLPPEEVARIRSEAIYEIGNMTLLTSKLNKKLRNYDFASKVNGTIIDRKKRLGMKEYAALSITKEIVSRDPLVWNESSIHKRTEKLIREFIEIWPTNIE